MGGQPQPVADASDGLALALRHQTADLHREAESAPFVAALLTGRLPLAAYVALVAQHLVIYSLLEKRSAALRPAYPAVFDARLDRCARIRADLDGLLGESWPSRAAELVVPATARYADRIRSVGDEGVIAHHYVRYLGDVAGGQAVRRSVLAAYGSGVHVSFYDFGLLGRSKPWRDGYREGLDRLPFTTQQVHRVVAEAQAAFMLNRAVFDDLYAAVAGPHRDRHSA